MFLTKLKLAAAIVVVGYVVLSNSAIHGESSPIEAEGIIGRVEPAQSKGAESTTQTPALSDSPAEKGADAQLAHILDEWQRRSAARTTLDVRFTGRERMRAWGDDESSTGRVVLASGGRAFLEISGRKTTVPGMVPVHAEQGTDTERIIWTDDSMHQFVSRVKEHFIWPIAAEDRGRLPAFLVLPFLWNVSAERLKTRYQIELLPDKQPDTWTLRFTELTQVFKKHFSKAYVTLDRSTYLPKHYILISSDRQSTWEYTVTESLCNQPVPEELWQIPNPIGWKVHRMEAGQNVKVLIPRIFLPDLLP